MSNVIATINEQELDFRVEQASFVLYEGKRVRLAPGFFRAAQIEPKHLMQMLLNHLRCQELEWIQYEYGVECEHVKPRTWFVYIDRNSDGSFSITAKCK